MHHVPFSSFWPVACHLSRTLEGVCGELNRFMRWVEQNRGAPEQVPPETFPLLCALVDLMLHHVPPPPDFKSGVPADFPEADEEDTAHDGLAAGSIEGEQTRDQEATELCLCWACSTMVLRDSSGHLLNFDGTSHRVACSKRRVLTPQFQRHQKVSRSNPEHNPP